MADAGAEAKRILESMAREQMILEKRLESCRDEVQDDTTIKQMT